MDVNKYMQESLDQQQQIIGLLERIANGLESQVTVDVRVPKETAAKVEGSSKQASNMAKEAPAKEEVKKLTADHVRAALMDLGQREGAEAAIALLEKHGATSVSGLASGKSDADAQVVFAAVIADAKSL